MLSTMGRTGVQRRTQLTLQLLNVDDGIHRVNLDDGIRRVNMDDGIRRVNMDDGIRRMTRTQIVDIPVRQIEEKRLKVNQLIPQEHIQQYASTSQTSRKHFH